MMIRFLVLLVCLSSAAFAAPPEGGYERMACKPPFERSIDALKPTPDLEKKLRVIDEQQGEKMREAKSEMRDTKRALYQGLEGQSAKEEDLKKLFADSNAASNALNAARFEADLQVWRILTPEQRKIWFAYRKCPRGDVPMRKGMRDGKPMPMMDGENPDMDQKPMMQP